MFKKEIGCFLFLLMGSGFFITTSYLCKLIMREKLTLCCVCLCLDGIWRRTAEQHGGGNRILLQVRVIRSGQRRPHLLG